MTHTKTPARALGLGAAGRPRRPDAETTRLGKEIYERDIRAQVAADHVGEVVAIAKRTATPLPSVAPNPLP